MAVTDKGELSDAGVHGELNPGPDDNAPPENPVPKRPAKTAPVARWVDYCVALGADRTFLTEDTEHVAWELEDGRPVQVPVTEPPLSRPQLIDLADRLGG